MIGTWLDRGEDLLGGDRDMLFRAIRQHDAETVAADATDHVADAQAPVEPLTDVDDHRIGGLIAAAHR